MSMDAAFPPFFVGAVDKGGSIVISWRNRSEFGEDITMEFRKPAVNDVESFWNLMN